MTLANNNFPAATAAQPWGVDHLTRAMDLAHANARRTLAVDPDHCAPLIEIDALYRQLLGSHIEKVVRLAAAMAVTAHSQFLGAAAMAFSGMVAEAYVLLNRSLRTAMQTVFAADHPERQKLWINRHNDAAARASMRAQFKAKNIRRHLRQVDAATEDVCEKLLRRTQDHSDHPNTYDGSSRTPTAEQASPPREYFVQPGEVQRYCLRSAAQVGICGLSVLYYAFPDQYRNSEIPARLTKLRQRH